MGAQLKNGYAKNEELLFFGISQSARPSLVAGRLMIWGERAGGEAADASIICILDPQAPSITTVMALPCAPAALVISSCALSPALLSLAAGSAIPFIILNDVPHELYFQGGKVALLDTAKSVLIIDPSIETLNRYPRLCEYDSTGDSVGCPLKLHKEESKCKFLLDSPFPVELFEALNDVSERFGAPPITLCLSVPRSKRDEEAFCEAADSLFRAAVYGDLSVMLKDFVSDAELSYALSLLHSVFCRLQQEGREFNGYVKKGALITSPAQLMRRIRLWRPDFLCFDLESLLCRAFGCSVEQLCTSADLRDEAREIWRHYLDVFAPECVFSLRCRELYGSELMRDFISFARIRDVYIVKN